MSNKINNINPLIVDELFSPLRIFLKDDFAVKLEAEFKAKYYNDFDEGEIEQLQFNVSNISFTFLEQIAQGVYEKKEACINDFFKIKVDKIVELINREFKLILLDKHNRKQQIEEYNRCFRDVCESLLNQIDIIQNKEHKNIISKALLYLKETRTYNKSNSLRSTKFKKKTEVDNSFRSEFFKDKTLISVLYDKLKGEKFIEECTLNHFSKFFNNNKLDRSGAAKLNWIGGIGFLRYFINRVETEFAIDKINSTKWEIANKCFSINGSNYDFTEQGSNGKKPKNFKRIDDIIKLSKQQFVSDSKK